jgi:uncharacterized protein YndB with AHSA1/START domain
MTTPNVPIRVEFSVELPGTPEQVWQAIATGPGLTAWFMPSEVEERLGGEFVMHMGDVDARATVAGWEPPRRFVSEEAEWAAMVGHEGADVTPLVTEFLVEAQSGGSCVLRVVSSAFGTGAEWEREFLDDITTYWVPMFDNLRLYLTAFPGQQATVVESGTDVSGVPADVLAAMYERLGVTGVGGAVNVHGVVGRVEKQSDLGLLVRYTDPDCGYLNLSSYANGEGVAYALAREYLFGQRAAELAAAQEAAWKGWFAELPAAVD